MQTPISDNPCVQSVWSRHQFFFFLGHLHNRFRVFYFILCGTNKATLFPNDLDFRLRNKNKKGYRDLVKTDILSLFGRGLLRFGSARCPKGAAWHVTKAGENWTVGWLCTCGHRKILWYQQTGTRRSGPKGRRQPHVGKPFVEVCASFLSGKGK